MVGEVEPEGGMENLVSIVEGVAVAILFVATVVLVVGSVCSL